MTDIKLFKIENGQVDEIEGQTVAVEKSLQTLIEQHLEEFFGIRFLASEFSTGPRHGGRIDTFGLDENSCPVIIEYKRSVNQNVINQGLYYLDWLMDHQGDFTLLVRDRYGREVAESIEWSSPRLVCIAGNYTKYDQYAVEQINRNIELTRYMRYGESLFLFELVNAKSAATETTSQSTVNERSSKSNFQRNMDRASPQLIDLFTEVHSLCTNLGDDVQVNTLQEYMAFKRFRNFTCIEVHPVAAKLTLFVKVNPDEITLEDGFTRDVRTIGHFGTGDLEITITHRDDIARAEPLILRSYQQS